MYDKTVKRGRDRGMQPPPINRTVPLDIYKDWLVSRALTFPCGFTIGVRAKNPGEAKEYRVSGGLDLARESIPLVVGSRDQEEFTAQLLVCCCTRSARSTDQPDTKRGTPGRNSVAVPILSPFLSHDPHYM